MKTMEISERLKFLSDRGVQLVDPLQVFVEDDVVLEHIFPGSVLFPGTRLCGKSTVIAPGAKVGSEGPATIVDSIIGADAEVASGFVTGSVLLDKARIGANGHIRSGTLLEEGASVAHAVGLKQTILTCFVTLGSLINCCDCLISGGRSRTNHTEVGSGFIHFNFTPWGESGDKATASIIGGIPRGVFLREERIFIGGLSGMVGPLQVGFGSFSVAGQIIRSDIVDDRIYSDLPRRVDAPWDFGIRDVADVRLQRNLEYIGHLCALKAWYVDVRMARLSPNDTASHRAMTLTAAIKLIEENVAERISRLDQYLKARNAILPTFKCRAIECPLQIAPGDLHVDHVDWVRGLSDDEVRRGSRWLQEIVDSVVR
jgi:UDP-N-acetylglucosamine/UDP-N-acetylgalactosamine diphosphorylase